MRAAPSDARRGARHPRAQGWGYGGRVVGEAGRSGIKILRSEAVRGPQSAFAGSAKQWPTTRNKLMLIFYAYLPVIS